MGVTLIVEDNSTDGMWERDYTYNLTPMMLNSIEVRWHEGSPDAKLTVLRAQGMLAMFDHDPNKFRAMNPANGWGNFDQFRDLLIEFLEWTEGRDLGALEVTWCK